MHGSSLCLIIKCMMDLNTKWGQVCKEIQQDSLGQECLQKFPGPIPRARMARVPGVQLSLVSGMFPPLLQGPLWNPGRQKLSPRSPLIENEVTFDSDLRSLRTQIIFSFSPCGDNHIVEINNTPLCLRHLASWGFCDWGMCTDGGKERTSLLG